MFQGGIGRLVGLSHQVQQLLEKLKVNSIGLKAVLITVVGRNFKLASLGQENPQILIMVIERIVATTGRGKESFEDFNVADSTEGLPTLNGKVFLDSVQPMLDGGGTEIVTKCGKLALLC